MSNGYHQVGRNCVFLNNIKPLNECFPRSTRTLQASPALYILPESMQSCEHLCGLL